MAARVPRSRLPARVGSRAACLHGHASDRARDVVGAVTPAELAERASVVRHEIDALRAHLAARKAELAELARRAKGAGK